MINKSEQQALGELEPLYTEKEGSRQDHACELNIIYKLLQFQDYFVLIMGS